MRSRIALASAALCLFAGIAGAEDLNLNEKPETTSVYLTPYAVGPGIGALFALNTELQRQSDAFLKFALAQSWRFHEHWDMGLDLEWWVPGANLGGFLNLNYVFRTSGFRPFVGLGAGLAYVDNYPRFGKGLGMEAVGVVGMYVDVTESMHMRLRFPVQVVGNSQIDKVAGLDVALMFSFPQYGTKVRKLKY